MMRHIARMVGLGALVAAAILAITAVSLTADAQEPEANLSFTKTAGPAIPDIGDTVSFTLLVSNTGGLASGSQTIEDLLPEGFTWVLGERSIECSIEDGRLLLCEPFIVPAAYFDGITPVAGEQFVQVLSVAHSCGSYPNDAWLADLRSGELTRASATLNVRCPATPTPIPPTATPTATPTQPPPTATPSPTVGVGIGQTPIVVVITATPTKGFAPGTAPLPPNTGGGAPPTLDAGPNPWAFVGALLLLAGLIGITFAVKYSRKVDTEEEHKARLARHFRR